MWLKLLTSFLTLLIYENNYLLEMTGFNFENKIIISIFLHSEIMG